MALVYSRSQDLSNAANQSTMSGQTPVSTTSKVPASRFPSERMGIQGQTAAQAAGYMRARAAGYQPQTPASSGATAGTSAATSSPVTTAPTNNAVPAANTNSSVPAASTHNAVPAATANNSATAPPNSTPTVAADTASSGAFLESLWGPNKDIAQKYLNELDARPFIPSLKPQPINLETFKGFKFVTADGFIDTLRDKYDKISGTIQWENWAAQIDSCINYINQKCANRRVFLVVSGGVGREIVPKIHQLPQVYAVYVFCGTVQFHLDWSKQYEKVRIVCSDDDQYLLPQLAVDVARSNMDWGEALLKKNDQEARVLAKTKFEKAKENLVTHAKKPDPAMVAEVEQRLKQCP